MWVYNGSSYGTVVTSRAWPTPYDDATVICTRGRRCDQSACLSRSTKTPSSQCCESTARSVETLDAVKFSLEEKCQYQLSRLLAQAAAPSRMSMWSHVQQHQEMAASDTLNDSPCLNVLAVPTKHCKAPTHHSCPLGRRKLSACRVSWTDLLPPSLRNAAKARRLATMSTTSDWLRTCGLA